MFFRVVVFVLVQNAIKSRCRLLISGKVTVSQSAFGYISKIPSLFASNGVLSKIKVIGFSPLNAIFP